MDNSWFPTAESEWMSALRPVNAPSRVRVGGASAFPLWQIDVSLDPVAVVQGRLLSSSETWNGKALVLLSDKAGRPTRHEAVAEVELAQRLRLIEYDAYWSGGNKRWMDFTLRSSARRVKDLFELDKAVRPSHPLLRDRSGGWPDVVAWDAGGNFICFEYKGPSPSRPHVPDTLYDHQIAWMETAISKGLVHYDRCAVVRWIPSTEHGTLLKLQAASKEQKVRDNRVR